MKESDSHDSTHPRVAVFQRVFSVYREGIFETIAASRRYRYQFVCGETKDKTAVATCREASRFPGACVPFLRFRIPFLGKDVYWQTAEIRAALSGQYDVLIFSPEYRFLSWLPAAILARLRGKKVICWGWGYRKWRNREHEERGWRWLLRHLTIALHHAVLLYDHRERETYIRRGIRPDKVFVAGNSLDTRTAKRISATIEPGELSAFRHEHGLEGKKVITFVGRFIRVKQVELLVSALPRIVAQEPDVKLVLIGDGPECERLKQVASDLHLLDHILFAGPIHDEEILARYLLCTDLAVSPGVTGLFANHAFMYGVPVVLSDNKWAHGAEAAKVVPHITGMLFRDGDPESLAEVVGHCLGDERALARMGANCRQLIADEYNEVEMAASFDRAVAYVLGQELAQDKPARRESLGHVADRDNGPQRACA